jgi:hypothetical protein
MNATLKLGLIGSSITLVLNLFGILVLGQAAAQFVTHDWWSVWFPSFAVWLAITIIGLGRRRPAKRA